MYNNNIHNIAIHTVFRDVILCRKILNHVSEINRNIIQDQDNKEIYKSVIKGKQLLDNGILDQMLRYNATQYFIDEFDHVSSSHYPNGYPQNDHLLACAAIFNNERVFKHLLTCTNMTFPSEYSEELGHILDYMRSCVIKSGSIIMLQAYLDISQHQQMIDISFGTLLMVNHGGADVTSTFIG
ncbi:hypothetical protein SAMD00019534_113800 [Acytostelium subglobosum LB1]|uniref:hypothetical protein n=1 Tax=Acytostelium subglobosum LB1 TaxID=1410327 RepID=UPI0006450B75|nr:hypothetical protein SAMD00019534_113800 [Acytostelium subglobosum LB1]GAM28204.1 hypothetical protein SAMD00019534_113800 [Acytostelium subglobosum LB1]|eukprot:XP_012748838.1 hypothetical protein SAMD00019534_113800 [Acytostelium subglobosum LB1]